MNSISQKKHCYPITENINNYLKKYGRKVELPLSYEYLLQYTESFPVGKTLWIAVMYPADIFQQINKKLLNF